MAKRTKGKAPGRYEREKLTIRELFRMIPDETAAEDWLAKQRWPDGPECPKCGNRNIHDKPGRKPQRFRCRAKDCKRYFSVKTGTPMHSSKISCQDWVYMFYMFTTNLGGVSSMRLHNELRITQRSAWFAAHRLRKLWEEEGPSVLFGAVECDETYVGGKARSMHRKNRWKTYGNANKSVIIGAKERATKKVVAKVIEAADMDSICRFLYDTIEEGATLYSDQHPAYAYHARYHADIDHKAVNHSAGEYVNGSASTQGIESFWNGMKAGIRGTYRKVSQKHVGRYLTEFCGRHNDRPSDTIVQMENMAKRAAGKRLRYEDLVSD